MRAALAAHGVGEPAADRGGGGLVGVQGVEVGAAGELLGAHGLLQPRDDARHHESGAPRGEQLADAVVAAHGDHGGGPVDERGSVVDEAQHGEVLT